MSDYKPVVGEECEYMPKGFTGWVRMTPTYVSDQIVCWTESNSSNELTEYRELLSFRPIRTQEEVEREEAIEHIREIISGARCTGEDEADELYKSGYRLVGEQSTYDKVWQEWHDSTCLDDFESYIIERFNIYYKEG